MSKKKYFTEEERKAAKREADKHYRETHKEERAEYSAQYYQNNKEKITEYNATFFSTPFGRACNLVGAYKQNDERYNRGECTLTPDWIVEHIFSQPCAHCGKTGWKIIGCNRLDNSLPHTPDNVEPCCCECNVKLGALERARPVYQYTLDGYLVKIWDSANECGRNGFTQSSVTQCCNGNRKKHKGHIWSYFPL